MMGQLPAGQSTLFYDFCLEDHVPPDHFLRQIDRILDLSELRKHLAPSYSHTGRPSIDPELMIRMLIIGYCYGIRSERRLCEEVNLNLAYRWFCRLGLEEQVPEHSTFSKNRHGRFRESDTLRFVFEQVLHRCIAEGLVGGEGFAIDASVIKADANRQRGVSRDEVMDWGDIHAVPRPVCEYLARLDEENGDKTPPKNISVTDPAAQWTAAPGRPMGRDRCCIGWSRRKRLHPISRSGINQSAPMVLLVVPILPGMSRRMNIAARRAYH
jgi:transposase